MSNNRLRRLDRLCRLREADSLALRGGVLVVPMPQPFTSQAWAAAVHASAAAATAAGRTGGMLVVPAPMQAHEWEVAAIAQQRDACERVRREVESIRLASRAG